MRPRWKTRQDFFALPWSLDKHLSSWIHLFSQTKTLPPLSLSLHYIFILLSLGNAPPLLSLQMGVGRLNSGGEEPGRPLCWTRGTAISPAPCTQEMKRITLKAINLLAGSKVWGWFWKAFWSSEADPKRFTLSQKSYITDWKVCTLSIGIKEAPMMFNKTLAYVTFEWTLKSSVTLTDPSSILNI